MTSETGIEPGRPSSGASRAPDAGGRGRPRPRLLFLVTEDWYFLSHRLPMARAAREAGFEVHVAARVRDGRARIEAEGFVLHALPWRRADFGIGLPSAVAAVRSLYARLDPDLIHHVALKPALLGSIAALGLGPRPIVNGIAGLGFLYSSERLPARSLRRPFGAVLARLMNRPLSCALVQNPDDRAALIRIGVHPDRIELIPGSGVDTEALTPLPEPEGPFTMALVARMLEAKGVREAVEAQRLLRARGLDVNLLLAGAPDPENPGTIHESELEGWRNIPGLRWLGHVADIRAVWAAAHVAVLPSTYGEGLPKSLLEAAACGRPIVATDLPGCREIARADVNAIRVPPRDPEALARAVETLMGQPELRRRFGAASRRLAVEEFSAARIGAETAALYGRMLDAAAGAFSGEKTRLVGTTPPRGSASERLASLCVARPGEPLGSVAIGTESQRDQVATGLRPCSPARKRGNQEL